MLSGLFGVVISAGIIRSGKKNGKVKSSVVGY